MFPNGLPGAGLLLLRLVAGILLIRGGITTMVAVPQGQTIILQSIAIAAGLLLLAGLWTPITGILVVVLQFWFAFSRTSSVENSFLLATLGGALALLGPGSRSVDAKLYGRKRIHVRDN
jgi:putative oxidoreductase